MKRKFPKDLLEEWGLPWTVMNRNPLQDELVDSGRWHEYHALVFRAPDDGKFWRVGYSTGLTEIQDMQPWDSEDEHVDPDGTVEGVEVEPFEVTTTQYRPVED